jgi:quinol monooxygenase YgiN
MKNYVGKKEFEFTYPLPLEHHMLPLTFTVYIETDYPKWLIYDVFIGQESMDDHLPAPKYAALCEYIEKRFWRQIEVQIEDDRASEAEYARESARDEAAMNASFAREAMKEIGQ